MKKNYIIIIGDRMKKGINAIIIVGTILSTIGIVFGLKVKFFERATLKIVF